MAGDMVEDSSGREEMRADDCRKRVENGGYYRCMVAVYAKR